MDSNIRIEPMSREMLPIVREAFPHLGRYIEKYLGVLAFYEDVIAGVATFENKNGMLMIQSVDVLPSLRRRGIGTALLQPVFDLVDKSEGKLFCCTPIIAKNLRDENLMFFRSLKNCVVRSAEGYEAVVDINFLRRLQIPKTKNRYMITNYFLLPKSERDAFIKHINKAGISFNDRWFKRVGFIDELCKCVTVGGKPTSVIFFRNIGDIPELSFFYPEKNCAFQSLYLLRNVIDALIEYMVRHQLTQVSISPSTERAVRLFEKLCPDFTVDKKLYTMYYLS